MDFIFAGRPLLHLPVWSIYLVALHYHHELSGKIFSIDELLVLFGISLLAASAYFINQVYDYQSDLENRKLGFLQLRLISSKKMMAAFLISAITAIFIASFISGFIFVIFLQLFILGFIYSVPPMKLKDRPISGLIANAYGFGFLIPLSIMPDITVHNAGLLGWDNPFYFFCTVASIYLLTTIPDIEGDKKTDKKTLAVIMPVWSVKIMGLLLMLLSGWIAFKSRFPILFIVSLISSVFILLSIFIRNKKIEFIAIKFPILLLTLLAGYFYPAYLLFVVALIILTRVYYKKRFNVIYPKLT